MFIEDAVKSPCILSVSGGLDSAHTLWKAAQVTDHIHVHHIDFGAPIERPQRIALERQIDYVGREKVTLHETTIRSPLPLFDYPLSVILSIPLARSLGCEYIVTGDDLYSRRDGYKEFLHAEEFLAYVESQGVRHTHLATAPDLAAEYLTLPDWYLAATWSCSEPRETSNAFHKCGWCLDCKIHQETGLWSTLPQSMSIDQTAVAAE